MEQYISKAAVVAEIKKKLQDLIVCKKDALYVEERVTLRAKINMCKEILSLLDTLEVKEVVAEQEGVCNIIFNRVIGDTWNLSIPFNEVRLKHGDKVKIFLTKEK